MLLEVLEHLLCECKLSCWRVLVMSHLVCSWLGSCTAWGRADERVISFGFFFLCVVLVTEVV